MRLTLSACAALAALAALLTDATPLYATSYAEPWYASGGLEPREGAVVFQDTEIWVEHRPVGRTPHLFRRDGREVPLTLVSEHAPSGERWDFGEPIERYRPATALEPGRYVLRVVFPPVYRSQPKPIEHTFRVSRGAERGPPPLPRVVNVSFLMWDPEPLVGEWASELAGEDRHPMRVAIFQLRLARGMLVADFGRADADPLVNLMLHRPDLNGLHEFRLGSGGLDSLDADYCTRTRVRFGALSVAGQFSGWTPWQAVNFPARPGTTCPAPAPDAGSPPSSAQAPSTNPTPAPSHTHPAPLATSNPPAVTSPAAADRERAPMQRSGAWLGLLPLPLLLCAGLLARHFRRRAHPPGTKS